MVNILPDITTESIIPATLKRRLNLKTQMNYAEIKFPDIANGPGARVSIFVSGCPHHCPGCFNEVTWNYGYGEKLDFRTISVICNLLELPYISGLSVLGGEPLAPENVKEVANLIERVKECIPEKSIWVWTGYIFEELLGRGDLETLDIFDTIDVLVDGPFILSEKLLGLQYRGSINQRVIDIPKSMMNKQTIIIPTSDRAGGLIFHEEKT